MKIAWIGCGVMGKPMALNLSDSGYNVSVYNRTFEKARLLEPKVKAYHDIKSLIKDVDIVFSIVGYPKDVIEVYEEVFKYAKKGTILVDMTTSSPKEHIKLYDKAKSLGLSMLDAPVTGGDTGAINRSLSIMVGGEYEIFEKVLPLLKLLGKAVTYMGKAGSGMHAKLANQTVIAGNIMAIAEALTYAKSKNLNLESMLNVISNGSASSWQAINNGPKMLNKDYKPGFFIKHFLKDLKLVIEEKENLKLEVLETVTKAYEVLSNKGYQELGTQAIIEYYLANLA
jgi:3-hydroxyisobutyrate dehydrogenase